MNINFDKSNIYFIILIIIVIYILYKVEVGNEGFQKNKNTKKLINHKY